MVGMDSESAVVEKVVFKVRFMFIKYPFFSQNLSPLDDIYSRPYTNSPPIRRTKEVDKRISRVPSLRIQDVRSEVIREQSAE